MMTFITGISSDGSNRHIMDDRRRYGRKVAAIRVEINHPAIGTMIGSTKNISDGGVSVKIEGQTIPPLGTEVNVRFIKVVGAINQEPVKMTVVHQHNHAIGLTFS